MKRTAVGEIIFSSFSFLKLNRENFKSLKFNVNLYLISQNLSDFTSDKVASEVVKNTAAVKENKVKENKALAILCLNIEGNPKNIIYNAKLP